MRWGRPDLGRLAPGCKADIVLVRIDTPKATPVYDPFKFLSWPPRATMSTA